MPTPDPNCKHYWILDAKNFGVCKYCGSTQQFPGIGDIEKGQGNSWRSRRRVESLVDGGVDMPGDDGDKEHKAEEFTVEDVNKGAAPFTLEELSKAEGAGVKLKIKSEKEQKRRRHNPDSTLKKVKCTYPGCTLGPDGGPYECDPRALHLHIQLQHGVRKHRTPKRIVRRILELFDAGTPQIKIIAALKLQNNFGLTSAGICGILNRERPDRVKKVHKRRALADEKPKEIDKKVDTNELLLEVMRLIVDQAPPEQIRAKALQVKKILSARAAECIVLSRLLDEVTNYLELTMEEDTKAPSP
jgi:hypothetical protein